MLAALGVRLDVGPETVARAIREAGVGFMWAPMHHPAMKQWAPIRPTSASARSSTCSGRCAIRLVRRQVLGVFDARWLEPMAHVLKKLGAERVWVVHGSDGLDELTTTGHSRVAELRDGRVALRGHAGGCRTCRAPPSPI